MSEDNADYIHDSRIERDIENEETRLKEILAKMPVCLFCTLVEEGERCEYCHAEAKDRLNGVW